MNSERRKHPRFILHGVSATLTLIQPPLPQLEVNGEVIDMSYLGIKIHLDKPIAGSLDGRQIIIQLVLPESGIPLTIKGVIKHQLSSVEYGLCYDGPLAMDHLDEFVFECTKPSKISKPLVIKNAP